LKHPPILIAQKFVFMMFLYVLLQTALYKLRENPHTLVAVGTIGAHMCGFANISLYGAVSNQVHGFAHTIFLGLGFSAIILAIFTSGTYLRQQRAHRHGDTKELQEWKEACAEMEDDAATLAFGLIVSQLVRWMILPYKPVLHDYPGHKTLGEIRQLLLADLIIGFFLFMSTYVSKRVLVNVKFSFLTQARVVHLVQGALAMSTAWITLFWSEWNAYMVWKEDLMVMKTRLAVCISAVVFPVIVIFSCDCVARTGVEAKALKSLVSALGLLVGLTWEKAFDMALGEAVFHPSDPDYLWKMFFAVLFLDLVVGPAWAFFVLPKASHHVHGVGAKEFWKKLEMNYEGVDDNKSLLEYGRSKFGFFVGDRVSWQGADEDVCAGMSGVVKGFTKARVRVRFAGDIYDFLPSELYKAEPESSMEGSADEKEGSTSEED